jgi:hypothetical protein
MVGLYDKEKMMNVESMIADFLSNGGRITHCKPGMPKDLRRLKRSGWLFGGKRTYVATLANRGRGDELYNSCVARPSTMK